MFVLHTKIHPRLPLWEAVGAFRLEISSYTAFSLQKRESNIFLSLKFKWFKNQYLSGALQIASCAQDADAIGWIFKRLLSTCCAFAAFQAYGILILILGTFNACSPFVVSATTQQTTIINFKRDKKTRHPYLNYDLNKWHFPETHNKIQYRWKFEITTKSLFIGIAGTIVRGRREVLHVSENAKWVFFFHSSIPLL